MNYLELKYPKSKVWYILVLDLDVVGYGDVKENQVLSTTALIDVYENEKDWKDVLSTFDIAPDED